jgi:choline kinase/phosphatidylglycerophosphate synthase/phosphoglycolate phosphatase-like HAD superfamily hydrolase
MKCLIIAAGQGTRLKSKGNIKPLVPLLGVPLIERVIRSAIEGGADEFYVITGYEGEQVSYFLQQLAKRLNVAVTLIQNEDWRKENGFSVLKARDVLKEPFLLLMADHLFDPAIIRSLQEQTLNEDEVLLAVDTDKNNPLIHMEDVTKVYIQDGHILNIGKTIDDFNGFDTGIFLCTPAIFEALERAYKIDNDTTLSAAIRVLAETKQAKYVPTQGFWIDVDDENAHKKAEKKLLDSLRGKSNDGPVSHWLNRPLSVLISAWLVRYSITPNQISFLSFVVSLASSLLFIQGSAFSGALLIHLSSILDGCDGEVARIKYMQSSFGDFFDAVLDRYADCFIFLGIFYYSLMEIGGKEVLGIYWSPLLISTIFVLAISGNLMVSYTSAKSVVNFSYKYKGKWIGAGKGRDIRLFQLLIGGVMTLIHPIFLFFAVTIIAVQTNLIVAWRTFLSWKQSCKRDDLITNRIKAVIFDFDGTIANTMPFLTGLAVKLMTENYKISNDAAHKMYLETTGLSFENQIGLIFQGSPQNQTVVKAFESIKQKEVYLHPPFPETVPALKYFRRKNIKTFICSSTKQEIITEYTKLNKIRELLEGAFGYKPNFGKGEQIDFVLKKNKLNPEEVLFVGDSLRDFNFAKDKQILFIGITKIFNPNDFRKLGALSVRNLDDLVKFFHDSQKFSDSK